MIKVLKFSLLILSILGMLIQCPFAYTIPKRQLDIKPYLNIMSPNNLIEYNDQNTDVEDDVGVGFGIKVRSQIKGCWGFVINSSLTDLNVKDSTNNMATIFTAGFYYSYGTGLGNIIFDLGYGVISVADLSNTLFLPSLEFKRSVTERISISLELSIPVVNDWFYDYDIKENFKSLSLSFGGTILF